MGVGLIGTKTISGLVLIGTKAIVFLWYDMRKKINRLWHDGSVSEYMLTMGMDAVAVLATDSQDNSVVRINGDIIRKGSGALT